MAAVIGDTAWFNRDAAFLKQNRVSVDIFGAIREKDINSEAHTVNVSDVTNVQSPLIAPLNGKDVTLAADEAIRLEVVMRTRIIGHFFTEGTRDINEVRMEVVGKDAQGNEFFHNGGVVPVTNNADSNAHYLRVRLFTQDEKMITFHNINAQTGIMYNNAIPPGNAQTVHYRMTIPKSAGDHVTIIAKAVYRKFNNFYTNWAMENGHMDTSKFLCKLPFDVVMAADTVTVKIGDAFHNCDAPIVQNAKLRERFNDYGIGLYNQGDARGAAVAFRRGFDFDSTYADAYINLARIAMDEGNLADMIAAINRADQIKPDYYKAHYFRGQWYLQNGMYDSALHEFGIVYDRFPMDRMTIKTTARIYYLKGEYKTALEWCDKELAIDPEDFTSIYQASQSYRALGQPDSADAYLKLWAMFKPDERSPEFAHDFRIDHPSENTEADAIHEHGNSLAPAEQTAAKQKPRKKASTKLASAISERK